jgi:hypothetical protein
MSVAVVYLARLSDGLEHIRAFASSYKKHPAGCPHELVILYKGEKPTEETTDIFREIKHRSVWVRDDIGLDIAAYAHAASILTNEVICFLNIYTQLCADNWLALLTDPLKSESVGMVGASGSYESVRDTIDFVAKAAWLCVDQKIDFDPKLAAQFEWIFAIYAADWLKQIGGLSWRDRLVRFVRGRRNGDVATWRAFWKKRTEYPGDLAAWLDGFPHFPNPHIRSNGFALRRDLFGSIAAEVGPSKEEAMHFESGENSLTVRILRRGLRAVVRGKDGGSYDVEAWPESETFRLGKQTNLVLTDNQSRNFDSMTEGTKLTHARVTWGDYAALAPASFIDLGFTFARDDASLRIGV